MKITMREVAKKANVSVATVSHVVNDSRVVSTDTREKVMDAIEELHFSPDIMARNFKTGRKHIIGLIVPDISNSFFAKIIEAIENILSNNSYSTLILNTNENEHSELEALKLCMAGTVDGVIMAPSIFDYRKLEPIIPSAFPIVIIDRTIENAPYDTVMMSDYEAITEGIDILIAHGHKRIGFIGASQQLSTTKERLRAYGDQLTKHNIAIDESIIQYTHKLESDDKEQITHLLDNGCTAIVASNNLITTNVVIYCDKEQISIPQQLELLGYKSSNRVDYFLPHSLYIRQPVLQMGRIAANRILQLLATKDTNSQNNIIPSVMDIDESSK